MDEINLVIFCKKSYRSFLPHCIFSIDKFVKDKIISKTIISDEYFKIEGFDVLTDIELWNKIDSDLEYKNLYNSDISKPGWTKQQIIKLSLDKLINGNILVVDADLLFLNPVKFVEKGKYNLYLSHEYDENYFIMIEFLLGVKKQTKKYQSFISDFSIFNSKILTNIKNDIEKKHKKFWIDVISHYIESSDVPPWLSEYELYGNYLLKNEKSKVNSLIEPIGYKMLINFDNYEMYSPEELISKIKTTCKNYYQCVNLNHV
jgi:hypothetical protein